MLFLQPQTLKSGPYVIRTSTSIWGTNLSVLTYRPIACNLYMNATKWLPGCIVLNKNPLLLNSRGLRLSGYARRACTDRGSGVFRRHGLYAPWSPAIIDNCYFPFLDDECSLQLVDTFWSLYTMAFFHNDHTIPIWSFCLIFYWKRIVRPSDARGALLD